MSRKLLAALLICIVSALNATAQTPRDVSINALYDNIYRPPNLQWQQLKTPHFNIIFPRNERETTFETGRILEYQYKDVQQLVGGELKQFPVVLNDYNDRSNGYVSPIHFRMEVEVPPIRGKSMNPKSGDWLETVMPHELVHALHLSVMPENSIVSPLSLFSPDFRRGIHGAAPMGVLEGIAVEHESNGVFDNAGRGNYSYFNRTFDAIFNSDQRWSMGQMVQMSSETRPFNRHYIGGYEFTDWLQQKFGPHTTRDAIDFHARWPFLGYGVALKHSTGQFPAALYNDFEKYIARKEKNRLDSLHNIGTTPVHHLSLPYDGIEVHRPKWLSSNRLIFYGSFYNSSPGFYGYNLGRKKLRHLIKTTSVEDHYYEVRGDSIWYARYKPSSRYDNQYTAEIYRGNLETGSSTQITSGGRISAPYHADGTLYGAQTDHASLSLARVDDKSTVKRVLDVPDTEFLTATVNPVRQQQWAVLAKRGGVQGIWLAHADSLRQDLYRAPDIAFQNGSVFDPDWHPSGDTLLFTADFSGTMQIYELSLTDSSLTQLTNAPFNAMEASYSPGGDSIAYVIQRRNERIPALLGREEFSDHQVEGKHWPAGEKDTLQTMINRPELAHSLTDSSKNWPISTYKSGMGWLKPRTWIPWVNEHASGMDEVGVRLYSSDLLRRNSYNAEVTYAEDRFWYDLTYRHTGFYPGFEVNLYSDPTYAYSTNLNRAFLYQERALALRVPIPLLLEQNVYHSSLTITPELRYSQVRAFELNPSTRALTPFTDKITGNLFGIYRHRLQQNIRDAMPYSGWIFFSELESDLGVMEPTSTDGPVIQRRRAHAFRAGAYKYFGPLRRWNQSFRLGAQVITQTNNAIFDPEGIVSEGFKDRVIYGQNNILSLNARYTIPFWYPDDGGLTVPLYLSKVYLTGFANSVGNLESSDLSGYIDSSRTIFGLGIRATFRISNLAFDVGVAFAVEPSRDQMEYFFGNF